MTGTLYERLGGEGAIMAATDRFYEKVLADETTRPFFDGLDMAKQSKKLVAFMAWAFNGPSEFKGRDLRIAHAPLLQRGLTDVHFDAVARHLAASLKELGVDDNTAAEVLGIVAGTRNAVLGR